MSEDFKPCEVYPSCMHHKCDCMETATALKTAERKFDNKVVEYEKYVELAIKLKLTYDSFDKWLQKNL
jgi:hypothetical protein